jgi:hypothetical protein
VREADNLRVPKVMKSGKLILLEQSRPHRTCYGTRLPFFILQLLFTKSVTDFSLSFHVATEPAQDQPPLRQLRNVAYAQVICLYFLTGKLNAETVPSSGREVELIYSEDFIRLL